LEPPVEIYSPATAGSLRCKALRSRLCFQTAGSLRWENAALQALFPHRRHSGLDREPDP
jgi:hypothetical protein